MRKIRILITVFSFILVLLLLVYLNQQEIRDFSKCNIGGNIINNTSAPIKIIDNHQIKEISANKSSKEMEIFDVDYIIIDKSTLIGNKTYTDGGLKICDYASISIKAEKNKNIVEILPPSYICKIINDFEYLPKEEIQIIKNENSIYK